MPWEVRLALSQADDGRGIERLWARNKIAALEESRVLGVDITEIDREVLNVALAHHLVSRLTSLVAVDVDASEATGRSACEPPGPAQSSGGLGLRQGVRRNRARSSSAVRMRPFPMRCC